MFSTSKGVVQKFYLVIVNNFSLNQNPRQSPVNSIPVIISSHRFWILMPDMPQVAPPSMSCLKSSGGPTQDGPQLPRHSDFDVNTGQFGCTLTKFMSYFTAGIKKAIKIRIS